MEHDIDDHDRGLAFDLGTLLGRRRALKLLAGAGALAVVGCGSNTRAGSGPSTTAATGSSATTGVPMTVAGATATGADCQTIPTETAGPFPGDGSNGPDVLTQSGIVRSDITSSFGSATGVAGGIPLSINLTVADVSKTCGAVTDAAVYVWHCDRDGNYSLYSQGAAKQNYLRGVQRADAHGLVTFKTIFPAAYPGRWPHIHFEVYPSVVAATSAGTKLATSQLALPEDACRQVYATDGYSASVRNLAQTSLGGDMVFGDGASRQIPTMTGSPASGFVASLTIPV